MLSEWFLKWKGKPANDEHFYLFGQHNSVKSMVLLFNRFMRIKIFFTISPHYNSFSSTFLSLINANFDSQHNQLYYRMGSCFCLLFTLHTDTELHVVHFVYLTTQLSLPLTHLPLKKKKKSFLVSYSHILRLSTHFPDYGNMQNHLCSMLLQNNWWSSVLNRKK